jgi:hypothetical protein
MLARRLVVVAVLVPIAANAVIGTIMAINQHGVGSKIAPIGRKMIGNVITIIKFGNFLPNVLMVQRVIFFMFIMVIIRVSATITARLFPKFLLYFFI